VVPQQNAVECSRSRLEIGAVLGEDYLIDHGVDRSSPAVRRAFARLYGRTRNPLYLGTTLIYLGLSVAEGSLWAIVLVVPLLWVINVGVIAREERYLERKFGDAYRAYKARVRRWV
jgi:steroid 5-alpha reductase family enzyme